MAAFSAYRFPYKRFAITLHLVNYANMILFFTITMAAYDPCFAKAFHRKQPLCPPTKLYGSVILEKQPLCSAQTINEAWAQYKEAKIRMQRIIHFSRKRNHRYDCTKRSDRDAWRAKELVEARFNFMEARKCRLPINLQRGFAWLKNIIYANNFCHKNIKHPEFSAEIASAALSYFCRYERDCDKLSSNKLKEKHFCHQIDGLIKKSWELKDRALQKLHKQKKKEHQQELERRKNARFRKTVAKKVHQLEQKQRQQKQKLRKLKQKLEILKKNEKNRYVELKRRLEDAQKKERMERKSEQKQLYNLLNPGLTVPQKVCFGSGLGLGIIGGVLVIIGGILFIVEDQNLKEVHKIYNNQINSPNRQAKQVAQVYYDALDFRWHARNLHVFGGIFMGIGFSVGLSCAISRLSKSKTINRKSSRQDISREPSKSFIDHQKSPRSFIYTISN